MKMAGAKRQKRTHSKDAGEATADSNDTAENAPAQYDNLFSEVDVPFRVRLTAPYQTHSSQNGKKPGRKSNTSGKRSSNAGANSFTSDQKVEQSRFDSGLSLSYTIEGSKNPKNSSRADWDGPEMKSYTSFQSELIPYPTNDFPSLTFIAAFEFTYKVGDLIYVKAPDTEAPGESNGTEYDYDDCWIAQILQIKALDNNHVYVRIFWMYRPDDIPGGRQEYHGDGEFIPSNDMQIINAETVNGKPQEWQNMDETDMLNCITGYKDLFYRQTYNSLTRRTTPALRKICICNTPMDPDFPPLQCANQKCETWLHPSCICNDILQRVAEKWRANKKGRVNGKDSRADHDVKLDDEGISESSLWQMPFIPSEGQPSGLRKVLSSVSKASAKTTQGRSSLAKGQKRKRDSDGQVLEPERVRVSFIRDESCQESSILSSGSSTENAAARAKTITSKVKKSFGLPTPDAPTKSNAKKSKTKQPRPLLAQVKIYTHAISRDDNDDNRAAPGQKSRKATTTGKIKKGTTADGEENEVVEVCYEALKCVKCGDSLRRQEKHVFLGGGDEVINDTMAQANGGTLLDT
ncbi:MAG: hypothetical protein M1831_000887 [Alyxoria varia]|nr:MAG: hypothetical protein M1831_000887 [Alyxoria varia]